MKIQFRNKELIVFESALYRTTTSLIIGEQYILLIDPNWLPIELDFIENIIQSLGKKVEKYLLFTHSDYDHIIGYRKFEGYQTIASKAFVDNSEKASILKQIEKFDEEYYIKRTYSIEYPAIDFSIAEDRRKMQIGSDEYQFFQAQGHNKDGLFVFNKTKKILIAGDYLSNIEFPYIYDSLKNYKQTLSKFEDILNKKTIKILVPGHGDYTTSSKEMKKRIEESKTYLGELEDSIREKTAFDEAKLYAQYQFPTVMKPFHQENIQLVKSELEGQK